MGIPASRVASILSLSLTDLTAWADLHRDGAAGPQAIRADLRLHKSRQATKGRGRNKQASRWLRAILCLAVTQVLPEPAQGQQVGIFQNSDLDGSRLEYTNPEGVSCKFTEAERAYIGLTAGVTQPLIVPGYGEQGGGVTSAVPVVGFTFRVPLGKGQQNCDALRAIDLSQHRLKMARLMFEDGAITKDQLDRIIKLAYQALLN